MSDEKRKVRYVGRRRGGVRQMVFGHEWSFEHGVEKGVPPKIAGALLALKEPDGSASFEEVKPEPPKPKPQPAAAEQKAEVKTDASA